MAKQGASTVTPRLRFRQFRNSRKWVAKPLKDICTINPSNDGLPNSFVYIDLESVEGGTLKSKNRIDRENAPSRAQRLLRDGDVIFQVVRPYQRNNFFVQIRDDDAYVASTGYAQLRANDSEAFLYQIIHTDPFVEKVIAKCTGSNYPAINSSDLGDVSVFAPQDPAEQQKIADCLTSLDEVIAAQGRKVEALKAHKRGLMQQLFPREGETRPRLRFPKFRNAAEWKSATVNTMISTITPPRKILTSGYGTEGQLPIIDQSPDPICGWTNDLDAKVDAHYPLIVFGDHTCVLKLVEHDFAQGADGIKIISALPHIDIRFLYFALQADPVTSASYRRHFSLLQEKHIFFPKELKEQQHIADCLSSLDTQITAESAQLSALTTHKQGLMQQLFPGPEVVSA